MAGAPRTLSYEDAYGVTEQPKEARAPRTLSYEDAYGVEPASRSFGDVASDVGSQLGKGVNTIAGAIPNLLDPSSPVSKFFNDNAQYWQNDQSQITKSLEAAADARIAEAAKTGQWEAFKTAVKEYGAEPALVQKLILENIPSMIPGLAAAKGAQIATKGSVIAGTVAGAGTNSLLNAGGARQESYQDIKSTLIAQGVPEAEADAQALEKSKVAAGVGAATGALSGGSGLERGILGGAKGGFAKRAGVELGGEQLEEVAPTIATNMQLDRDTLTGVGETSAKTLIASSPGSVISGFQGNSQPVQPTPPGAAQPDIASSSNVDELISATKSSIDVELDNQTNQDLLDEISASNNATSSNAPVDQSYVPQPDTEPRPTINIAPDVQPTGDGEYLYQGVRPGSDPNNPSYWFTDDIEEAKMWARSTQGDKENGGDGHIAVVKKADILPFADSVSPSGRDDFPNSTHYYTGGPNGGAKSRPVIRTLDHNGIDQSGGNPPANPPGGGSATNQTPASSDVALVGKKEPWQMTKAEYDAPKVLYSVPTSKADVSGSQDFIDRKMADGTYPADTVWSIEKVNGVNHLVGRGSKQQSKHSSWIIKALSQGEHVPDNVLADYPNLTTPASTVTNSESQPTEGQDVQDTIATTKSIPIEATPETGSAVGIAQEQVDAQIASLREKLNTADQSNDLEGIYKAAKELDAAIIPVVQARLDSGEMPVFKGKDLTYAVHPAVDGKNLYQVTTYSDTGAIGDSRYKTLEEAIRESRLASREMLDTASAAQEMDRLSKAESAYQEAANTKTKPIDDPLTPFRTEILKYKGEGKTVTGTKTIYDATDRLKAIAEDTSETSLKAQQVWFNSKRKTLEKNGDAEAAALFERIVAQLKERINTAQEPAPVKIDDQVATVASDVADANDVPVEIAGDYEDAILARTPTIKERLGGVTRQRGFNSITPREGYSIAYKPYGNDGNKANAGYYYIKNADTKQTAVTVAPKDAKQNPLELHYTVEFDAAKLGLNPQDYKSQNELSIAIAEAEHNLTAQGKEALEALLLEDQFDEIFGDKLTEKEIESWLSLLDNNEENDNSTTQGTTESGVTKSTQGGEQDRDAEAQGKEGVEQTEAKPQPESKPANSANEKLQFVNDALEQYGASLNDDGYITKNGKTLSVRASIKKGRLTFEGSNGNKLFSGAPDEKAVSAFVEDFWKWEKISPAETAKEKPLSEMTPSDLLRAAADKMDAESKPDVSKKAENVDTSKERVKGIDTSKLTYAKPSTIDTPAQGVLNQAREGKAKAWEKVQSLRERIKNEPLGGNRSGLRLELVKAEDSHREYQKNEKEALAAIEKRANELGFTTIKSNSPKFSKSSSTINVNGIERSRLNSNGKPIANTDEALHNFWEWFSDSKVVDDQGRPLVVYHGTNNSFDEFSKESVKSRFPYSFGLHFTTRTQEASVYADSLTNAAEEFNPKSKFAIPAVEGGNVMPSYLKSENPLEIVTDMSSASMEADTNRYDIIGKLMEAKKNESPYDSVIIKRQQGDEYDGQNIIVFDPNQVKSAIGNNGDFNKSNNSILKSQSTPTQNTHTVASATSSMLEAHTGKIKSVLQAMLDNGKAKVVTAEQAAEVVGEDALYMTAWHGSPHDHDGFSMDKVGTGEGAQAYGHGLYFAGRKEVAEYYRDTLSGKTSTRSDNDYPPISNRAWARDIALDLPDYGKRNMVDRINLGKYDEAFASNTEKQATIAWINGDDKTGRLYQVELAPSEDEYLLWDKPLSEQSEKVKAALQTVAAEVDKHRLGVRAEINAKFAAAGKQSPLKLEYAGATGEQLYNRLMARFKKPEPKPSWTSVSVDTDEKAWSGQKAASEYLHSLGIRGIKYLDGSSRGYTANYKKQTPKYQEKVDRLQAAYDANKTQENEYKLSDAKQELQSAIRADKENEGEFNYVIFNDKDVKITAKFAKEGQALAFYNPLDDTTYFIADHIPEGYTPKEWEGLVLHEIATHALQLGRDSKEFKSILSQIDLMRKAGNKAVVAAFKRVPKDTRPENVTEEAIAYLLQESPQLSIVQRVLSWFRNAIRAIGKSFPILQKMRLNDWANNLNEKDLRFMAESALKNAEPSGVQNESDTPQFSKLSHTATAAFKKWFGESKVVDGVGRPLIVYHGAPDARFVQEDGTFKTTSEKYGGNEPDRRAFWFTDNRATASSYAKDIRAFDYQNAEPGIIEAYIKLENPLIINAEGKEWRSAQQQGKTSDVIAQARAGGHDGVIIRNVKDDYNNHAKTKSSTTFTVFSPNQIKSTDNNGDFSQSNNNILFSKNTNPVTHPFQPENSGKPLDSWIKIFTRNQIVTLYRDSLIGKKLEEYKELRELVTADTNKLFEKADNFLLELRQIPKGLRDAFASLAHDSTLNNVDPSNPKYVPSPDAIKLADYLANNPTNQTLAAKIKKRLNSMEAAHKKLYAEFNALPAKEQELFKELRSKYTEQMTMVFNEFKNRIGRMKSIDPAIKASSVKKLDEQLADLLGRVYFPLYRAGNYIVKAEKAGEPTTVDHVESNFAADRLEKKLKKLGYTVSRSTRIVSPQDNKSGEALNAVRDLLDKAALKGKIEGAELSQLMDDIDQTILQSLPDQSYRKSFIHRKGTKGYSDDFIRAYADAMRRGSINIANLRHGDKITTVIEDMRKDVKDASKVPGSNVAALNQVVDRVEQIEVDIRNPTSKLVSVSGKIAFAQMLGSLSNFILNLTQIPLLTMPHLGAEYGYGKANLQLSMAYAKQMRSLKKQGTLSELGKWLDMRHGLVGNELDLMQQLHDSGALDLTQSFDLIDAANNPSYQENELSMNFMKVIALPQHVSEIVNRQVTALATIRLEMARSGSPLKAYHAARKAIDQTHFNYSKENRAKLMTGNTQSILFRFKQYAQQAAFLFVHTAKLALDGSTNLDSDGNKLDGTRPSERTKARKQLAGVLGMQILVAGTLGLPVFAEAAVAASGVAGFKLAGSTGAYVGVAGAMIVAAALAFGDDDGEEFDVEVKKWFIKHFGEGIGSSLADGVIPRGLASRLNASELVIRRPKEARNSTDFANQWMISLLGAFWGGTVYNAGVGLKDIVEGDTAKGTTKLIPVKAIKDLVTSWQWANDGMNVTNKDGEIITPVSKADIFFKSIGINPTSVVNAREYENAKHTLHNALLKKQQKALKELREETDKTKRFNAIIKYNKSAPLGYEIDSDKVRGVIAREIKYKGKPNVVTGNPVQEDYLNKNTKELRPAY